MIFSTELLEFSLNATKTKPHEYIVSEFYIYPANYINFQLSVINSQHVGYHVKIIIHLAPFTYFNNKVERNMNV